MTRIVILGSTGMLGHKVFEHFSNLEGYEVFGSYRNKSVAPAKNSFAFDAESPDWSKIPECDYVLNCIGVIKPFMKDNTIGAIKINSFFPWALSEWCESNNTRLIHITTDCVFSGNDGSYTEESLHDCLDDYGKSKSLGEPTNCMVIRTSIIGEEIHKNASLIAWAKTQKGKSVNGFLNHDWNGVTTLEYAKVCQQVIDKGLYEIGLHHVHSPQSVNKFELLQIISDRFELELQINPYETANSCDRTLSSGKELINNVHISTIQKQIEEL
jgi:dTDP-4-dehydrorhamnose reductase